MGSPARVGKTVSGLKMASLMNSGQAPTTVVDIAGRRIVMDPTFDPPGPHAYLTTLAGPAFDPSVLGAVDAVLISRDDHPDNLDDEGLRFALATPLPGPRVPTGCLSGDNASMGAVKAVADNVVLSMSRHRRHAIQTCHPIAMAQRAGSSPGSSGCRTNVRRNWSVTTWKCSTRHWPDRARSKTPAGAPARCSDMPTSHPITFGCLIMAMPKTSETR
jgi:hypothetical protein